MIFITEITVHLVRCDHRVVSYQREIQAEVFQMKWPAICSLYNYPSQRINQKVREE